MGFWGNRATALPLQRSVLLIAEEKAQQREKARKALGFACRALPPALVTSSFFVEYDSTIDENWQVALCTFSILIDFDSLIYQKCCVLCPISALSCVLFSQYSYAFLSFLLEILVELGDFSSISVLPCLSDMPGISNSYKQPV